MKKIQYLSFLLGLSIIALTGCNSSSTNSRTENEETSQVEQSSAIETETPKAKDQEAILSESKEEEAQPKASEGSQTEQSATPANGAEQPKSSESPVEPAVNNEEVKKEISGQTSASTSETKKETSADKDMKQEVYNEQIDAQQAKQEECITIGVYGDSGTIVSAADIDYKEGMTVFDALKQVLKDNKVQMEYSGQGKSIYIEGINNLYEFDKGPGSGWIFKVNGSCPSQSCSAYVLQKGDSVDWYYTLDFGKDIG